MNRAIIYCRISQAKKNTNEYTPEIKSLRREQSLDSQEFICKAYCKTNNMTVTQTYNEICSGRFMAKMSVFKKMIKEVQPGTTIVVSEVSRFIRNTCEGFAILNKLADKNVSVYSVSQQIMFGPNVDAARKFYFKQLLNQAELEVNVISERQKRRVAFNRANGGKIGKCGYGFESFKTIDGIRKQRVNQSEKKVLDMIEAMFDDNKSARTIATELNTKRIPYRNGRSWTAATISYLHKKNTKSMNTSNIKKELDAISNILSEKTSQMDLDDDVTLSKSRPTTKTQQKQKESEKKICSNLDIKNLLGFNAKRRRRTVFYG